jgi:hypothetical protein
MQTIRNKQISGFGQLQIPRRVNQETTIHGGEFDIGSHERIRISHDQFALQVQIVSESQTSIDFVISLQLVGILQEFGGEGFDSKERSLVRTRAIFSGFKGRFLHFFSSSFLLRFFIGRKIRLGNWFVLVVDSIEEKVGKDWVRKEVWKK